VIPITYFTDPGISEEIFYHCGAGRGAVVRILLITQKSCRQSVARNFSQERDDPPPTNRLILVQIRITVRMWEIF